MQSTIVLKAMDALDAQSLLEVIEQVQILFLIIAIMELFTSI